MRPQDSSTGVPACLRAARILAVGATAFGISAATANGAGATPAGDLQAQAAQLNAQIQAHGAKVAALGEQLDAAQLKLETAQAQMSQLETIVRERAVIIYQSTDVNSSLDFSTTNVLELTVRSKYASVLDAHDRQLLDRLNEARREVTQQRVALVKDKADADAAAAQEQRLLSQVTGQLAVVIQEQRQQQQQAAAAVSVKLTTPPANNTWAGPAPSGGAGAAVAFAEAQLGKPDQYGAAGPDACDCSGLTMRPGRQAASPCRTSRARKTRCSRRSP